jgi:hypothetical protein
MMTEPLWSDERLNGALAAKNISALIEMRDEYEANRRQGRKLAEHIFGQFHAALIAAYVNHFEQWARADDLAAKLTETKYLLELAQDELANCGILLAERDGAMNDLSAKLDAAQSELHDLRIRAGVQ